MKDFGKETRRVLKDAGCWFHRQGKGSHEMWKSPHADAVFAVPVKIPSRHLANAIMKQAGLPKMF